MDGSTSLKAISAKDLVSKLQNSRGAAPTGSPSLAPVSPSGAAQPPPIALNPAHDPKARGGSASGAGLSNTAVAIGPAGQQPQAGGHTPPPRKRSIIAGMGFNEFTSGIRAGWQTELHSRKFRAAVLAEFLGMALFVAFGTGCVAFSYLPALNDASSPNAAVLMAVNSAFRQVTIPLAFGLMITVMVFAIGDISGANLNPAVTLALTVCRKMSPLRCGFYMCAQLAGATVGAFYIRGLLPDQFFAAGGAINEVGTAFAGVNYWTLLGGEALGTFLLVFTVCAAADVGRDNHTKYVGAMTPLTIGFAVLLAHLLLMNLDGCSINPARSFGTAAAANHWNNHWISWAGPFAGSLLAALSYELIYKAPAGHAPAVAPAAVGYTGVGRGNSMNEILDDIPIDRTISDGGHSGQHGGGGPADPMPQDAAVNDAYFPASPGRPTSTTALLPPRPRQAPALELSPMVAGGGNSARGSQPLGGTGGKGRPAAVGLGGDDGRAPPQLPGADWK